MTIKLFRGVHIIGLLLCVACNSEESEWSYKKLLPPSASYVKEFVWTEGFLPDYVYYLRAKISASDFKQYCDTLGLKLHTDSTVYSDDIGNLYTGNGSQWGITDWWNAEGGQDSLFVWQSGDEWNIARYYHGYLYLYAHEH